jgi:diacylglycerol kinase family enzyme
VAELLFHPLDDERRYCHYFVNIASVGMIPCVVMEREKIPRWVPSKLQYLYPSLKTIATYPSSEMEVTIDGVKRCYRVLSISIAKGRFAGGGMTFAKTVNLQDGRFEVTLFLDMHPLKMLMSLGSLYTGNLDRVRGVVKRFAEEVLIHSEHPLPIEFDGELAGMSNAMEFRPIPLALNVCCPPFQKI